MIGDRATDPRTHADIVINLHFGSFPVLGGTTDATPAPCSTHQLDATTNPHSA